MAPNPGLPSRSSSDAPLNRPMKTTLLLDTELLGIIDAHLTTALTELGETIIGLVMLLSVDLQDTELDSAINDY